jgi:tRNA 2-thiouridine synthesizing protein D
MADNQPSGQQMNFAIVVHGDPASSAAPANALRFAVAVLAKGHRIERVFFYHDAVRIADSLAVTPQDEHDVALAWAEFGRRENVELAVCVASALRRGVLGETDAQRYQRASASLREPFQIVGLGQLVDAAINADRLITFTA